jgi:phosphatidylinositol glycan class V
VPSNIPLFILAAPALALVLVSARAALLHDFSAIFGLRNAGVADNLKPQQMADIALMDSICRRFALPQLALAGLTVTTFHVQIITRLSSGYPLWYLFTASLICGARKDKDLGGKQSIWSTLIVRWMLMYALIQGVLFAGFLPPA